MKIDILTTQTPKPSFIPYVKIKQNRNQTEPNSPAQSPLPQNMPIWKRKQSDSSHAHICQYKQMRNSILGVVTNKHQSADKIQTAVDLLVKDNRKKVGEINKYVAKKREMVLMQMKIEDKQKKMTNLHDKLNEKETKINGVQDYIKRDLKVFNGFIKESKNKTKEMLKLTQDEIQAKEEVIETLNNLNARRVLLTVNNTKTLNYIKMLLVYKKFIGKLANIEINQSKINIGVSTMKEQEQIGLKEPSAIKEKDIVRFYNINVDSDFIREINNRDSECDLQIQSATNVNQLLKEMQDSNLKILHDTQNKLHVIALEEEKRDHSKNEFQRQINELTRQKAYIENQIKIFKKKMNLVLKIEVEGKERVDQLYTLFMEKVIPISIMLGGYEHWTLDEHLEWIEKRVYTDATDIYKYPEDKIKRYERNLLEDTKTKSMKIMAEKENALIEARRQKLFKNDFVKRFERRHNFRRYLDTNGRSKKSITRSTYQDEYERYFT